MTSPTIRDTSIGMQTDLEGLELKPHHGFPVPSTGPLEKATTLADPEASKEDTPTWYPEGGLQAWSVVFGSFAGMVACFGLANAIGTFQAYLSTHQLSAYDQSTVGWIFSIYIFLAFFCGVQIGPVFDAKGPRWLVLAGSVCLLGGVFGLAEATGAYITQLLVEALWPGQSPDSGMWLTGRVQSTGTSSSPFPFSEAWARR